MIRFFAKRNPERRKSALGPVPGTSCFVEDLPGAFRDITDRRRLEREREAMEMPLRPQQRLASIGTLAGGIPHEINNPAMGIMNGEEHGGRLTAESEPRPVTRLHVDLPIDSE